ncbi:hypothetical protein [Sphingomonas bacterium]|uniref:hypothetical protein n=1 Tax=Sphingomonas bacterium TaxID=1895847 RepID=UPI00261633C9|nr:hypothetical protein [Sphingomonas bacterium]MDB5678532.1 hypothetical protein [Sphingomonas bacterium]
MIPLAPNLDDVNFDDLLAVARARLPALAPQWTDYNYHDPGIMLVELLAWLADSQVYSLSRNRQDEQAAMARMLGVSARGAVPAQGMLFPAAAPATVQAIASGAVLKPAREAVPRVEVAHDIHVLPVEIARVATDFADSHREDHTAINARARATFAPFGEGGDGTLRIELERLPAPAWPGGPVLLSIGVEVAGAGPAEPPHADGRIHARDSSGRPLDRRLDDTYGLQRSGVIVLAIDSATFGDVIELRPAHHYALSPRLVHLAVNALPVVQRATIALPLYYGNDRAGQTIAVTPGDLFLADEMVEDRVWRIATGNAVSVTTLGASDTPWTAGRLDPAGPDDRRYAITEQPDGSSIRLRFGNGINGLKPALDEDIQATLTLSCGAGGDVRHPIEWELDAPSMRWRNRTAIEGGKDAQSVAVTLAAVRPQLASDRVLATADEIEQAALTLDPALAMVRATVIEGWEPGRARPAIPATRTLIVGHRFAGRETRDWLTRIRRAIIPRIAIGERLIVVAPVYRPFTAAVTLRLVAGADRAAVIKAVQTMLADRFDTAKAAWPLGRDVDHEALAGWIRRVDGVSGGVTVQLTAAGRATARIVVGPGDLPQLAAPADVTGPEGGR